MQEGAHQRAPDSSVRATSDKCGALDGSHSSGSCKGGGSSSSKAPGVATAAGGGGAVSKRIGNSSIDRTVNAKTDSVHMGLQQQQEQVQQQVHQQQQQQQLQALACSHAGSMSNLDAEGAELTTCKQMDMQAVGTTQSWSSTLTHTAFASEAAAPAPQPACQGMLTCAAGHRASPPPGGLCTSGSAGSCGFVDAGAAPPSPAAAAAAAAAGGDAEPVAQEEMDEGGDAHPKKVQRSSKVVGSDSTKATDSQAAAATSNSCGMNRNQTAKRASSFLGEVSGLAGGSCTSSITNFNTLSCLAPSTPGETSLNPPPLAGPCVNVEAAGPALSTWASDSPHAPTANLRGVRVPPLVFLEPPPPLSPTPQLRSDSSQLLLPPVLCSNPANRGALPGVGGVSAAMEAAAVAADRATASMEAKSPVVGGVSAADHTAADRGALTRVDSVSAAMNAAVADADRDVAKRSALPRLDSVSAAMDAAITAADQTAASLGVSPGVGGGSTPMDTVFATTAMGTGVGAEGVRQGLVSPGSPVGGHVRAQDFALATVEVQRQQQQQQHGLQEQSSLPSHLMRAASLGTQQELWHAGAETERLTKAQADWSQTLWSKQQEQQKQQQQRQVHLPETPPPPLRQLHTPPALPQPHALPPHTMPTSNNNLSAPLPKPLPLSAATGSGWRVVPDAELATLLPSLSRSLHAPSVPCILAHPSSLAPATAHVSSAGTGTGSSSTAPTVPILSASAAPIPIPPPTCLPYPFPHPIPTGQFMPTSSVVPAVLAAQHATHPNSAPLPLLSTLGAPPALCSVQHVPGAGFSSAGASSKCCGSPSEDVSHAAFHRSLPNQMKVPSALFPPSCMPPPPLTSVAATSNCSPGAVEGPAAILPHCMPPPPLTSPMSPLPSTCFIPAACGPAHALLPPNIAPPLPLCTSTLMEAETLQEQQQQQQQQQIAAHLDSPPRTQDLLMADGMSLTGCESRELMMSADEVSAASNTQHQQQQKALAAHSAPEELMMGGEEAQGIGLDGEGVVPEARMASFILDSLEEVLPASPPP